MAWTAQIVGTIPNPPRVQVTYTEGVSGAVVFPSVKPMMKRLLKLALLFIPWWLFVGVPQPVWAAITFDNAADVAQNAGSGNIAGSPYTVGSGSNRFLFVSIVGDVLGGSDDISSVTYAGVSMSLSIKQTTANSDNRFTYLYYLAAPATGSNNVAVSCTSPCPHYVLVGASSYAGVAQVTPEATTSAIQPTNGNITTTLTTLTNNDWTILMAQTDSFGPTAVSGATRRAVDATYGNWSLFDSNGAITPAGMTSMIVTNDPLANGITTLMVAIAPFTAAGGNTRTLLGVGQ